jgi:hypothetical protein
MHMHIAHAQANAHAQAHAHAHAQAHAQAQAQARAQHKFIPTTFLGSKPTLATEAFTAFTDMLTAAEGRNRTEAITENMPPPLICVSCIMDCEYIFHVCA